MTHHENAEAVPHLAETVAGKKPSVKRRFTKTTSQLLGVVALFGIALASTAPAQAEDVNAKTILNATRLINYLNGVLPSTVPNIIQRLKDGTLQRVAPEQPAWIIDADNGVILYYQGQPGFERKEASQLVDDSGQRFGLKAVNNAKQARGTWLNIVMGAMTYRAYCANRYPYVACSLNPEGAPLKVAPPVENQPPAAG